MMPTRHKLLRDSLAERVRDTNGPRKSGDLGEIEDAYQYGETETLELFDRLLHTGCSLYFLRVGLLNTAREIKKDIAPSLTEDHLRVLMSVSGSVGVTDDQMRGILKMVIDYPEDSLLISSILRERKIIDPDKIMELMVEQCVTAPSFSTGML